MLKAIVFENFVHFKDKQVINFGGEEGKSDDSEGATKGKCDNTEEATKGKSHDTVESTKRTSRSDDTETVKGNSANIKESANGKSDNTDVTGKRISNETEVAAKGISVETEETVKRKSDDSEEAIKEKLKDTEESRKEKSAYTLETTKESDDKKETVKGKSANKEIDVNEIPDDTGETKTRISNETGVTSKEIFDETEESAKEKNDDTEEATKEKLKDTEESTKGKTDVTVKATRVKFDNTEITEKGKSDVEESKKGKYDDVEESAKRKSDNTEEIVKRKLAKSELSAKGKLDDTEIPGKEILVRTVGAAEGITDDTEESAKGKSGDTEESAKGKSDDTEESAKGKSDDTEESVKGKSDDNEESTKGKSDDTKKSAKGKSECTEESAQTISKETEVAAKGTSINTDVTKKRKPAGKGIPNQLHFFVGANFCGKSTVLELIRRCMSEDINDTVTSSFNEEEIAYVFCKFDLHSGEVISGVIKEGKECNTGQFHKILIYTDDRTGRKIIRCKSFKFNHSMPIKEIFAEPEDEDAIKDLFNKRETDLNSVRHIKEKIISRNDIIEKKKKEVDWKDLENTYIATMPLRGIGIVQWTKSKKFGKRVENYTMACERAEIISELLREKERGKIDINKEKKYFDYLTYPEKFTFKQDKAQIYVKHGSHGPFFPLLKTSEGILEAKQVSLLLAHEDVKTLTLEEPCRGMHAQMVERLRAILYQEGFKKTIIVSTHNPYFIDTITINNTHVFFRIESKDSKYSCNVKNVGHQRNLSKVSDVETLRSILFATKVLLVEGPIDRDVVQSLFTHRRECRGMNIGYEEKPDITTYQIIPVGGCQNAKDVMNFCNYINLPALCLLDRDKYVTITNLQPVVGFRRKLVVLQFSGIDKQKIKLYTERFQYRVASCFIENETGFQELSDYLIQTQKTFIWKCGKLEDAILSSRKKNKKIAKSLNIDLSDLEPAKRCGVLKNKLKERLNQKERKEFSEHLCEVAEIKRFLGFIEDEENKRMQNQIHIGTKEPHNPSNTELKENFVKFSSLLLAEGTFMLTERIKYEIAKDNTPPTFTEFIDNNKHTLFHLFERKNCCRCEKLGNKYNKIMSCEQWSCSFEENTNKCQNSTSEDECCCRFSVVSNLDISTLDITLLSLILLNICTLDKNERERVKNFHRQTIRYFAPISIPYMTEVTYRKNFKNTRFALETIGKAIGNGMPQKIKIRIEKLKNVPIKGLCGHLIDVLQLQKKTKAEDIERIVEELRHIQDTLEMIQGAQAPKIKYHLSDNKPDIPIEDDCIKILRRIISKQRESKELPIEIIKKRIEDLEKATFKDLCRHLIDVMDVIQLQRKKKGANLEKLAEDLKHFQKKIEEISDNEENQKRAQHEAQGAKPKTKAQPCNKESGNNPVENVIFQILTRVISRDMQRESQKNPLQIMKKRIEDLEEATINDLCRHLIDVLQLQRKTKGEAIQKTIEELKHFEKKLEEIPDTKKGQKRSKQKAKGAKPNTKAQPYCNKEAGNTTFVDSETCNQILKRVISRELQKGSKELKLQKIETSFLNEFGSVKRVPVPKSFKDVSGIKLIRFLQNHKETYTATKSKSEWTVTLKREGETGTDCIF